MIRVPFSNKIVLLIFYISTLIYSECGYAVIEKTSYQDGVEISLRGILTITNDIATKLINALTDNTQVEPVRFLVLEGSPIAFQPGTLNTILSAIQHTPTLKELIFSCLKITIEEIQAIVDVLLINKNINYLVLRYSDLGNAGAQIIANLIANNNVLTDLDLSDNKIGKKGILAIITALRNNRSLTRLNLRGNYIAANEIEIFAELLRDNNSLTELMLGANDIRDEGTMALAEALHVNRGLITLALDRNYLTARSARALAEALQLNTTLRDLRLNGNRLDNAGLIALAQALTINRTLLYLDIRHTITAARADYMDQDIVFWEVPNDIRVGLEAIIHALVNNMTIQEVAADWLPEQEEIADLIFQRNHLVAALTAISTRICSDTRRWHDLILYGNREELLQYFSLNALRQVNEIRELQLRIRMIAPYATDTGLRPLRMIDTVAEAEEAAHEIRWPRLLLGVGTSIL